MGRVLVVGSINMDVVAFAPRLPVPGETLAGSRLEFFPGGKGANQAVAAAKTGAETLMHGCLGADDFGIALRTFLKSNDVDVSNVEDIEGASSGTAIIVVDETGENSIVIIPGSNAHVLADSLTPREGDVVVCQFEIPLRSVRSALEKARSVGATTILNPAPAVAFDALELADYLILNEQEAKVLGVVTRVANQTILVTHGKEGAAAVGPVDYQVAGRDVLTIDTTGAGDCFVGSFAARLALGDLLGPAMEYANAAAAISVTRPGAGPSMPTADEVRASL